MNISAEDCLDRPSLYDAKVMKEKPESLDVSISHA